MPDSVEDGVAAALRALPDLRGKANIAHALRALRRRSAQREGAWDVRLSEGSVVCLPRSSLMSWTVAATGHWERHLVAAVTRYVRPNSLVLDIGASVGMWSLPLAREAAAKGALLWCFEPDPENVRWLTANIRRNDLDGVAQVQPVALGAQSGRAQLGHREHRGGNAALQDHTGAGSIAVDVRRLDDLRPPRPISFMKLDVEGFELAILRGARMTIERDRPVIFGEFSIQWLGDRGEDLPGQLRSLEGMGYEVYVLEETRSASWRAKDAVRRERLRAPFAVQRENLLLLPA